MIVPGLWRCSLRSAPSAALVLAGLALFALASGLPTETPPPKSPLVHLSIDCGVGPSQATIVGIHGLGDTAENFSHLLRDFPGPAKVIIPQAPLAHNRGWSWFPTLVRETGVEVMSEEVLVATEQVSELLTELISADPAHKRVLVTGFSQGGMLSFALATRHPEQVGLAVPLGGWLPEPLWPEAPPPGAPRIVALHGERDRVLPLAPTQAGVTHLRAKGWQAELVPYPNTGHAVTPPMLARLWQELQAGASPAKVAGPEQ